MSLGRGEGGTGGEGRRGGKSLSVLFHRRRPPPFFIPNEKCCLDALAGEKGGGEEKDLGDKFDYARLLTAVSHTQN